MDSTSPISKVLLLSSIPDTWRSVSTDTLVTWTFPKANLVGQQCRHLFILKFKGDLRCSVGGAPVFPRFRAGWWGLWVGGMVWPAGYVIFVDVGITADWSATVQIVLFFLPVSVSYLAGRLGWYCCFLGSSVLLLVVFFCFFVFILTTIFSFPFSNLFCL